MSLALFCLAKKPIYRQSPQSPLAVVSCNYSEASSLSKVGGVTSGKKSALIAHLLAYHFVGPLANITSWAFVIFLSDSSILLLLFLFLGLKFYPIWRPNSELRKSFLRDFSLRTPSIGAKFPASPGQT